MILLDGKETNFMFSHVKEVVLALNKKSELEEAIQQLTTDENLLLTKIATLQNNYRREQRRLRAKYVHGVQVDKLQAIIDEKNKEINDLTMTVVSLKTRLDILKETDGC